MTDQPGADAQGGEKWLAKGPASIELPDGRSFVLGTGTGSYSLIELEILRDWIIADHDAAARLDDALRVLDETLRFVLTKAPMNPYLQEATAREIKLTFLARLRQPASPSGREGQ